MSRRRWWFYRRARERAGALARRPALVANIFALFLLSPLSKAKVMFVSVECVWAVEKEW